MVLLIAACTQNFNQKFNKSNWMEERDLQTFPYRDNMLNDLTTNYKLKGLTYKQLIDLIGEPQNNMGDTNTICYPILVDYGFDIDPVHSKTLVIELNNDSIVIDYKIDEWKK